jgi:5-(carboxyamino)imidazole ribonucleotide synthase
MFQQTIGIIGGGQLGLMLARAANQLGFKTKIIDSNPLACAKAVCNEFVCSDLSNNLDIQHFLSGCDYVTNEFEGVDNSIIESAGNKFNMSLASFRTLTDKLLQKQLAQSLGIPTLRFSEVNDSQDIVNFIVLDTRPFVLKARKGGFDGRGVQIIQSIADVPKGLPPNHYYIEEYLCPDQIGSEMAVVAVKSGDGEITCYIPTVTYQKNGICTHTITINHGTYGLHIQLWDLTKRILENLDYVGVLAVEYFVTKDCIYLNEIAPRVHNSGHWTIEGSETSQFENHIRAVTGLPIGKMEMTSGSNLTYNIIPTTSQSFSREVYEKCLAIPGAHLHLYGKEARPGRKIGHVTIRVTGNQYETQRLLKQLQDILEN